MLFGDPDDFAIEAMVEPDLKIPSSVFGRMCVHVGPTTLGDFEDVYCSLGAAYGMFEWHSKRTDRLWDDLFDGMSPEEIHDTVHSAIYFADDRSMEEIQKDRSRFADYDFLSNRGEQFDGYHSVIVSPDDDTMLILRRPYADIGSPRRLPVDFVADCCSRSSFMAAATAFVAWFETESKRVGQREG